MNEINETKEGPELLYDVLARVLADAQREMDKASGQPENGPEELDGGRCPVSGSCPTDRPAPGERQPTQDRATAPRRLEFELVQKMHELPNVRMRAASGVHGPGAAQVLVRLRRGARGRRIELEAGAKWIVCANDNSRDHCGIPVMRMNALRMPSKPSGILVESLRRFTQPHRNAGE